MVVHFLVEDKFIWSSKFVLGMLSRKIISNFGSPLDGKVPVVRG